MRQTRTFLAIVTPLLMVLVVACATPWGVPPAQQLQSRPESLPSPTVVHSVDGLLRPAASPAPTAVTAPLTITDQLTVTAPTTITTAELVKLSTEQQMARVIAPVRDLRELAMRLVPNVGEIPLVVNKTTPDYEVGDQQVFWAHDMDDGHDFTVTAELVYKTDAAYAWVQVGQPYDKEKLQKTIDRFTTQSVPVERAFFGSEWNPGVDNDPRMHILHVEGIGSFIAGFYSNGDEYSHIARPTSNEKEMFYVNLDWLNHRPAASNDYDVVLAHEFQHMIHWHIDKNEETWVGEGLSEYAQDIAGFGPTNTFSGAFLHAPDTQLDSWGPDSKGNDAHYGAAYLFMVYFTQRFGAEMTRALVADPANGVDGINDVLASARTGLTFDDVYADWVVANYADDPNALDKDGFYGYRDFDQAKPEVAATYDQYPTDKIDATVNNYGTDYLLLQGEGDHTFHFHGNTTAQLADLPPSGGAASSWWSNRGDSTDTRLTRQFDLTSLAPGSPVKMAATMWWDVEKGYDYVYVVASRDGKSWTILPGDSTTPSDGTSSFGPGYTGASDGWHTEHFDLSSFAGDRVFVRFEYVTDDAINGHGLFLNQVAIPAIRYASDFQDGDGWQSEGWIYTDNHLRQKWIVQLMTFEDNKLVDVQHVAVNEKGDGSVDISGLGNSRSAVIAISGAAPVTLETASYKYWFDQP